MENSRYLSRNSSTPRTVQRSVANAIARGPTAAEIRAFNNGVQKYGEKYASVETIFNDSNEGE